MKITGVSAITGRGHMLTTDLRVTVRDEIELKKMTRVRISGAGKLIELGLSGVGSGRPSLNESARHLCLLVALIEDPAVLAFVEGKEFELLQD